MSSIAEQLLEKCRSKPQQEDDHRRVGDDASGAVELDAPLSLCEVEHSISVVERRSQDVQVEIQSRIQKNMALFQAEMARVNRLQDSATAALDHLAQAKVEVETGIESRLDELLERRSNLDTELHTTLAVLKSLKELEEFKSLLGSFKQLFDVDRNYKEATKICVRMDHIMASSPNPESEDLKQMTNQLNDCFESLFNLLQTALQDAFTLSNRVSVEAPNPNSPINQPPIIEFRVNANASSMPLPTLIDCLRQLEASVLSQITMHHCKEVLKNVLLPLIKDSAWIFSQSKSSEDVIVFERSGNPSFLNDKIGWHQDWKGELVPMLWRCFDFICSAFSRDKYILGIIGNHIYPDVCSVLISEILSKLIPDNARQLQSFEVHKLAADSFEQALLDQGFIQSSQAFLSSFCSELHYTFANTGSSKLLESARVMLMADASDAVMYEEMPVPNDNNSTLRLIFADILNGCNVDGNGSNGNSYPMNQKGEGRGGRLGDDLVLRESLCLFPKCLVSSRCLDLLKMVEAALTDASCLDARSSSLLVHSAKSALDLYRICCPLSLGDVFNSLPQPAAIFHNDCMLISHRCLFFALGRISSSNNALLDLSHTFRIVATSTMNAQLAYQQSYLNSILESADAGGGFDSLSEERSRRIEKLYGQISHHLRHLGGLWKNCLPEHVHLRCLGILLDCVVDRVVQSVTGMIDIGADESHRINRVMLILSNLCVELVLASSSSVSIGNNSYNIGSLKPDSSHTIVSSSSPSAAPSPPSTDLTPTNVAAIQAYVRSFSKYHVVSLILVMSLSDIDMNVQSGAWEQVLNKNEQGRLVRALFTDSPKREGVMKRINGF